MPSVLPAKMCLAFTGVPCLQALATVNSHSKAREGESSNAVKDAGQGKQRALTDAHSNVFVLRKMVEEVFSVLYSRAHLISVIHLNKQSG